MRRSRIGEIQDRFWQRVEKKKPDECWPWKGTMHGSGYGVIQGKLFGEYVEGRPKVLAHRASWVIHNGPFPEHPGDYHGWVVLHACDNPRCVNPAHLTIGLQHENVKDMDRKARDNRTGLAPQRGTQHRRAKLTSAQVAEIVASDETHRALAERLGVSTDTVERVRRGQSYVGESCGVRIDRPRFSASGEENPNARLTYEQVKLIRTSPLTTHALAKELGISQTALASARRGATYKDVDVPIPEIRHGRPRKR
jgi:hypothetical protein